MSTQHSRIITGDGPPAPSDGQDLDIYHDTLNARIYPPKEAGAWGLPYPIGGPQTFTGIGTTGAGGLLTVNFPTAFAATPAVSGIALTGSNNVTEVRVTAASPTSFTLRARSAASITVLGIQVVAFPTDAVGVTVHYHAIEQGDFT